MLYRQLNKDEINEKLKSLREQYEAVQKEKLNIDISRGKPCKEQLDISMPLLNVIDDVTKLPQNGMDLRNYGGIEGYVGMRKIFADMLGVDASNVICGNNSSLNMMYDTVQRYMQFGVMGMTPWNNLNKVKFLCPSPGYDRHFAICEVFGIEMIAVPMDEHGPVMSIVKELVASDESIKGIWCVPKYSNPTGITYSDEVVDTLASMECKAKDFRIFWDNAYAVHDLYESGDSLKNLYEACTLAGNADRVLMFSSTSKITFSGAGVAALAASEANIKDILKTMQFQTICPNKINQYAHWLFLKDIDNVKNIMRLHADIIRPKFEKVLAVFNEQFADSDIAVWSKPKGGYFISFDTLEGCAKRVGKLCKDAGLVITTAGATYPLGIDDKDNNIRIAPTFTKTNELDAALRIFVLAVKIASLEKLSREI